MKTHCRIIPSLVLSILGTFYGCTENPHEPLGVVENKDEQYVFHTDHLTRYEFPTHFNELIIDRADSRKSEIYKVLVEPCKTVIHHQHEDLEQVFYILEGQGWLYIGENKTVYLIAPGEVVRIPPQTLHSVKANDTDTLKYLCIDCYIKNPSYSSFELQYKVNCELNHWEPNISHAK